MWGRINEHSIESTTNAQPQSVAVGIGDALLILVQAIPPKNAEAKSEKYPIGSISAKESGIARAAAAPISSIAMDIATVISSPIAIDLNILSIGVSFLFEG